MASAYGLYLEQAGITDRATVFIDAGGTVRFSESVTPKGARDIPALVDQMIELAGAYDGELEASEPAPGLADGSKLFIKSNCGFSKAVLAVRSNLHLEEKLPVVNVSESGEAMDALKQLSGKEQAPCLATGGDAVLESGEIIKQLVSATTGMR